MLDFNREFETLEKELTASIQHKDVTPDLHQKVKKDFPGGILVFFRSVILDPFLKTIADGGEQSYSNKDWYYRRYVYRRFQRFFPASQLAGDNVAETNFAELKKLIECSVQYMSFELIKKIIDDLGDNLRFVFTKNLYFLAEKTNKLLARYLGLRLLQQSLIKADFFHLVVDLNIPELVALGAEAAANGVDINAKNPQGLTPLGVSIKMLTPFPALRSRPLAMSLKWGYEVVERAERDRVYQNTQLLSAWIIANEATKIMLTNLYRYYAEASTEELKLMTDLGIDIIKINQVRERELRDNQLRQIVFLEKVCADQRQIIDDLRFIVANQQELWKAVMGEKYQLPNQNSANSNTSQNKQSNNSDAEPKADSSSFGTNSSGRKLTTNNNQGESSSSSSASTTSSSSSSSSTSSNANFTSDEKFTHFSSQKNREKTDADTSTTTKKSVKELAEAFQPKR